MKVIFAIITAATVVSQVSAQTIAPTKSNIPYVENGHERQVLDIYAGSEAKDLPVMFWIHGGGWHMGDKSNVGLKPNHSSSCFFN